MNFLEKGGSLQSEKLVAKKRNIFFQNEGGGGHLEVFRKFIQNGPRKRPLKEAHQAG